MRIDEHGNLSGTSTCLWEAITHIADHRASPYSREKAYYELQRRLGECACLSWQEIGITPSPEGWIINIRACNEDGRVDILIPKDRNLPVQIITDTRAISAPYDDLRTMMSDGKNLP